MFKTDLRDLSRIIEGAAMQRTCMTNPSRKYIFSTATPIGTVARIHCSTEQEQGHYRAATRRSTVRWVGFGVEPKGMPSYSLGG